MKVYILRHEKRYESHDFNTSLTDEGLKNTQKLKNVLDSLDIDYIFTSPYKRVIQTIEPFLKHTNKKIHVDYALNESLYLDDCRKNIKKINKNMYGYNYINLNYKPIINWSDLDCNESIDTLNKRTNLFYKSLKSTNNLINKNILIVSHMSPINGILKRDYMTFYPQGGVTLIYDNKNVFIPINYSNVEE